jgi:hypothetical protein
MNFTLPHIDPKAIERGTVDLVAGLAPWLAPVPTAYMVAHAALNRLKWPLPVAVAGAAALEALGITTATVALTLYEYNQGRKAGQPEAPFKLAVALVGIYFVSAVTLSGLLEIFPALTTWAPAIFPVLTLAGVGALALRSDHDRRLQAIADEKAERKAERAAARAAKAETVKNRGEQTADLDRLKAGKQAALDARIDRMLDVYAAEPMATPSEAARQVGVSRQTIYSYLDQLEQAGKIRRNGHGVEILK